MPQPESKVVVANRRCPLDRSCPSPRRCPPSFNRKFPARAPRPIHRPTWQDLRRPSHTHIRHCHVHAQFIGSRPQLPVDRPIQTVRKFLGHRRGQPRLEVLRQRINRKAHQPSQRHPPKALQTQRSELFENVERVQHQGLFRRRNGHLLQHHHVSRWNGC